MEELKQKRESLAKKLDLLKRIRDYVSGEIEQTKKEIDLNNEAKEELDEEMIVLMR